MPACLPCPPTSRKTTRLPALLLACLPTYTSSSLPPDLVRAMTVSFHKYHDHLFPGFGGLTDKGAMHRGT